MEQKSIWIRINNQPPIHMSSGSMEAVKWLALLAMTIDHVNRFFLAVPIYSAYCIGRLAMPLFAFVFAYHLAQPDAFSRGVYGRVLKRLFFFGFLATPAFIGLQHLEHFLPLNILFSLAIATAILFFYEQERSSSFLLAMFIFLMGGAFVEYNWIGIYFCIASWFYCKKPSIISVLAWFFAYLLLDGLNGNHWALLTVIIILLATKIELNLPRIPHFFYYYYPGHLWILYLLSR